jgi:hypothetical protein
MMKFAHAIGVGALLCLGGMLPIYMLKLPWFVAVAGSTPIILVGFAMAANYRGWAKSTRQGIVEHPPSQWDTYTGFERTSTLGWRLFGFMLGTGGVAIASLGVGASEPALWPICINVAVACSFLALLVLGITIFRGNS